MEYVLPVKRKTHFNKEIEMHYRLLQSLSFITAQFLRVTLAPIFKFFVCLPADLARLQQETFPGEGPLAEEPWLNSTTPIIALPLTDGQTTS